MSANPQLDNAPKPRAPRQPKPAHRTNAVVDDVTQQRIFTEAMEHATKPWSLDSQPAHVRAAVQAQVDMVEELMHKATTGPKAVRPLAAVQVLVRTAWLIGWHAGRHFEQGMAKAKRAQSASAAKATREARRVTTTPGAGE